ncbi:Uncharacterised protein [Mycoplasmopsis bovigenitalium]|uniref:Lipoprotein n=1 Tax=Mycoplasmopsis bovigenitalium TaxID=2112 RepID=A0A449A874_9BACT|nr:variable surface lipoprotein [Mycoplasmopsis bovigenitalium]VEU60424.1 Uncharacterised protein [Mycoplasmopsis bovigenitalium]
MKKKIIWALATLSTFPLIAASCQSKTKNNPQQTTPSEQNVLNQQEVKRIKELKQAVRISKQIYQEIEKSNPEDKLVINFKPTIQKFYTDFESKLSKEIKSDDVEHLRNKFSQFLDYYLMIIYIKYDYKDLRDHILKTFPEAKNEINQVDARFNELSNRDGYEKNAYSSLLGNLTVIYGDKLLKYLDKNPDADVTFPPDSRFSKIYPEKNLKEIKMTYSGMYKSVESLVKNKPEYQEKIKKINDSLNHSSTMRDYSAALFRLNHLLLKLFNEDVNNDKEYKAATEKYNETYEKATALFDKEKDKSLYDKLMRIHEHLSSTANIIQLQEATSKIEELIKEKNKTA